LLDVVSVQERFDGGCGTSSECLFVLEILYLLDDSVWVDVASIASDLLLVGAIVEVRAIHKDAILMLVWVVSSSVNRLVQSILRLKHGWHAGRIVV
jgi:hypothetical protein